MNNELNEYGMRVWKHKTNKRLFLQQSYRWKDSLSLIDETEGRQIVDSYRASNYDFGAWTPMTQEEYNSVKSKYREVYEQGKTSKLPGVNTDDVKPSNPQLINEFAPKKSLLKRYGRKSFTNEDNTQR